MEHKGKSRIIVFIDRVWRLKANLNPLHLFALELSQDPVVQWFQKLVSFLVFIIVFMTVDFPV